MESKNVNETSNTEIITISRAEYDELMAAKAKNAELAQQNNWLMERLKFYLTSRIMLMSGENSTRH